jgi:hypothetical protein
MYELTEKGREELERYRDATEDDLRLTKRSLMIPVLASIDLGYPDIPSIGRNTGLEGRILTGTISKLSHLGYIEILPPGPEASKEERLRWSNLQWQRAHPGYSRKHPASKEAREESVERQKERYPEAYLGALGDIQYKSRYNWFARRYKEDIPTILDLQSKGLSQAEISRGLGIPESGISIILEGLPKGISEET